MEKDPYETLAIKRTATQDEIKDAYRKLAKKYHPDLNPGDKTSEKKFKGINAAYELIGTPEQRAKYDRGEASQADASSSNSYHRQYRRQDPFYHQTQQEGGRYTFSFGENDGSFDEDLFSNIFRGAGQNKTINATGQDVLYELEISFKDAVLGSVREITLGSEKKLQVKIPPGIEAGQRLRFAGQGEKGKGHLAPGDAYVQIKIQPSSIYKRNGQNLEMELPISLNEAISGGEVKVPTLIGSILIKIPPQTSSGSKLRVSGKGVPAHQGKPAGDLYIALRIVLPSNIDPELKQAIEMWEKRHPYSPRSNMEAGI